MGIEPVALDPASRGGGKLVVAGVSQALRRRGRARSQALEPIDLAVRARRLSCASSARRAAARARCSTSSRASSSRAPAASRSTARDRRPGPRARRGLPAGRAVHLDDGAATTSRSGRARSGAAWPRRARIARRATSSWWASRGFARPLSLRALRRHAAARRHRPRARERARGAADGRAVRRARRSRRASCCRRRSERSGGAPARPSCGSRTASRRRCSSPRTSS